MAFSCTPRRLGRGFFGRSLDEFKRLSRIALTAEAVTVPKRPFPLIYFENADTINDCKTMSDADLGGFSESHFDFVPGTDKEPPHAHFHGNISIKLPEDRPEVVRTGYAGWRTLDRKPTLFGRSLWDIDPYSFLAIRFKSDGRPYFVNIQTESIVPTDLHQHRLYARKPGQWETVLINFNDFVRTNHGSVVEPQSEMLRQKVKSVGISLIDRVPKPFDLRISRIWATNGLRKEDMEEDQRVSHLKGKETWMEPQGVKKPKEAPEKILI